MQILEYPQNQKLLRTPGKNITPEQFNSAEFQDSLKEMVEILEKKDGGIGLAATQLGWMVKLFVLNCDENLNRTSLKIFLNSRILSESKQYLTDSEACLSFPNLSLRTKCSSQIKWEYQDVDFMTHQIVSDNYYARVIVHEIGHLNGNLLIDRASSAEQLKFKKWLKSR